MTTLVFQILTSVAVLVLALTALAVARHWVGPEDRRAMWLLSGIALAMAGLTMIVQDVGAVHAFRSGAGSRSWDTYLLWAPPANRGRSYLMLAYSLLLATAATRPGLRRADSAPIWVFLLCVGALIGVAAGLWEGRLVQARHFTAMAASSLTLLTVLAVALTIHLSRRTMDRLLWACLAVYVVHLALNAMFMAGWAHAGLGDFWIPSHSVGIALDMVSAGAMVALALRALVLVRRRRVIRALLDPLEFVDHSVARPPSSAR